MRKYLLINFLFLCTNCFTETISKELQLASFSIKNSSPCYLLITTKNDIHTLLGEPESTEYFQNSGEDFYWTNITIDHYEDNKILFVYNADNSLIRISAYISSVDCIKTVFGNVKETTEKIIKEYSSFIDVPYRKNNFLCFTAKEGILFYCFWFNEDSSIKYIDFYFDRPCGK